MHNVQRANLQKSFGFVALQNKTSAYRMKIEMDLNIVM